MKLISWNVNGLRAALGKGFATWLGSCEADLVALQEVRLGAGEAPDLGAAAEQFPWCYYHPAEKPGYSGTALLCRTEPLGVWQDFDATGDHPAEGRVQTLELAAAYLVNVYVPNAQDGLRRLGYRRQFNADLRHYLQGLRAHKPVIICGDFNVAHQEIDLARPQANRGQAGFSDEERADFSALLADGFLDSFREQHPNQPGHYTWWSFRGGARTRNVGWRLDYFLVDTALAPKTQKATILADVLGSDHCPILLEADLT